VGYYSFSSTDCAALRSISSVIRGKILNFHINAIYSSFFPPPYPWHSLERIIQVVEKKDKEYSSH
jgi:hypothetical protein